MYNYCGKRTYLYELYIFNFITCADSYLIILNTTYHCNINFFFFEGNKKIKKEIS